ncbi:oligosaccharide repeat unit polymerase [Acinetobacter towneri]|uniref:O-antigen polymerase n=1 Tax=Acinetobacter towneri TaxID=202956 RepID=UPI002DBB4FAE|nr:O-antigen polymerase [Acinetobacter towneri]MEB6564905.1 oligosaccharide repeat unit polymerase [Acinetobacter towneri]
MDLIFFSGLINLFFWLVIFFLTLLYMRMPIYHPFFIYLIYHFIGYVLRPFFIYSQNGSFLWNRIGVYPENMDILILTVISNIALIFVFFGFIAGAGGFKKLEIPQSFYIKVKKPIYFSITLIILVVLGLYANYVSMKGAGLDSVLAYQTSVDSSGGARLVGTSGYITAWAEFLPPICILLFMIPKIRKLAILLISAYVIMRFFAGAQRLAFVIVIAGVFFYYLISKKQRYPSIFFVIFLIFFAYIFDIIGGDRLAMRKLVLGETTITEILQNHKDTRGDNALTSDVVEYDVAASTLKVIHNYNEYSYGTQYLRILIWPIPRQIWQDKPVYTSIVNLNEYGDFRYLTTGIYADSYMAFSYISLTIIMFILGYFFSRMYNVLLHSDSVVMILFYWIVLIFTKTILRDGGVTFIYFWVFSLIPVLLLSYLGSLKVVRLK